jgi:hypothetical protein
MYDKNMVVNVFLSVFNNSIGAAEYVYEDTEATTLVPECHV